MKVIFYKLIKIDNEEKEAVFADFENQEHINAYVRRILDSCATASVERKYKFDSTLTTTKDRITKLIMQQDVDEIATELGMRLAKVENDTNAANPQLKGKIPLGILLLALADMETDDHDFKLMVIKSDYDEFIAERTGQLDAGLSIKNQIFKTCVYDVNIKNQSIEWKQISTSDSTKRKAEYWSKTFLELEELYSDDSNTVVAYDQIKKKILDPIKSNGYKSDWLLLSNETITYMRSEGPFDLDYYRDSIIGTYNPYDKGVCVEKLKQKVDKLRELGKFDPVFNKVPSKIKDKIKNSIKLSDELELHIKHEIAGVQIILLPATTSDGRKGITIVSESGYEYALGLKSQS